MRKILDAFLGSVKDGIHPREIALAVALGILAGFVTGWNLTLVTVLVAVVLLRVPFQMFGQAWAVSAMVSWMMTPATFRMGHYVLEESPLAAMFAANADSLPMVLFDLDRYTLAGGIVWGLILAVPCAWLALRFSRSLQVRLRSVGEAIKQARFSLRAICWLMFGSLDGVTKDAKERWMLRPFGFIACALTVVPMCGLAWMYGPGMVEQSVLHTLSLANQAEVSADSFELSFVDGTLRVQNLQIADSSELDHDRMRVANMTAVLKPAPLLRGRVHIEKILIDGITTNVPRDIPAKAYHVDLPDFDLNPHVHFDGSLEDLGYKLETYARNWLELKDRMNQVQDMLTRLDALTHRDDEVEITDMEIPAEYRAMRDMRCNFGSPRPNVLVDLVRAKHLAPKWGLGDEAMMEITNLNSEPKLLGRPTRIEFAVPDHSFECVAHLNYHQDAPHNLHLKIANVSMTELIKLDRLPQMAVSGGALTFHGEGTFDSHGLELPLDVQVERLSMALPGGTRQLGLPAELWNQGLSQLGGLQLAAKLHGEWESPRLDVDTDGLVAQFQQQLHAAGHAMLASAVNDQVQRGQAWMQEEAAAQLARGQQYVDQGREAADAALQTGREAVDGLAGNVQSTLDQANNKITDTQNRVNDQLQDTVNRALGGLQGQQNLADQFLRNRLNSGGAANGQSPAADAAAGLLNAATGNIRQGVNHVGGNLGHVIDVAGNNARGAVDQGSNVNAAAQDTANNSLNAGQNVVENTDQTSRYGMQGVADQANRYADQLGGAANGAVQKLGPPTVAGGPVNSAEQTVPEEVSLQNREIMEQSANRYSDRYADYRSGAQTQQQGQAVGETNSQATPETNNTAQTELAGNPAAAANAQRPVGEPAALLYPESMRSARQLQPAETTAQAGRYDGAGDANRVVLTADQVVPNQNAETTTPFNTTSPNAAGRTDDRYAGFYQRPQSQDQLGVPPGAQRSEQRDPPGADYYANRGGSENASGNVAQGSANTGSSVGQSRYGAVNEFMEEVGQRSAANVPAGQAYPQNRNAQYPAAGSNRPANVTLPPMASASSVASDAGVAAGAATNGAATAANTAQRPSAVIPPVGFDRGYVPQEPFTPEEYQALLLMQKQQQPGTAQVAEQQPQGSSWKKLADNVTGGAKKLWPFGRSTPPQQQGSAAAGDTGNAYAGQYPASSNASGYASDSQQQPQTNNAYGTAQPPVQQAEVKDPWYRRLFRR